MDDMNRYEWETQEQPPRPSSGKKWLWLLGVLAAMALIAGAFLMGSRLSEEKGQESSGTAAAESSEPARESSGGTETTSGAFTPHIVHSIDNLTIVEIAEKAAPSVVEITTESVVTGNSMTQYISSGAGSGVILTEDGYILTNNHVIDGASNITVTTSDGASYPAVLKGLDEHLDVALLKIEVSGLKAADVASSADLSVGQEVVAIGNPLGQLGGTVTNGIISALNRSITIDDRTKNLLQTNAAINPGNSGGGLFDASGNLVGLVVAKYSDEEIEGIGFAIPIDDVMSILDDLYTYGYVPGRADLGLSLLDITSQQMAWMYRVSRPGVYIYQTTDGGAADQAGLRSGDRIVTFNGVAVSSVEDITDELNKLNAGDTVTMDVSRSGRALSVSLTVGEYVPEGIRASRQ